jgi:hypothetical protein
MGMPSFRGDRTQFGETQIDFEQEDPVIYEDYARALAKTGVAIRQEKPVYVKE